MTKLINSVEEIFTSYLDHGYKFNIPEYQRGYKWSEQQVKQLLDDINNFTISENKDSFYCLQNITIVPARDNIKYYDVIDGQQRLTTLIILLAMLGESSKVKDKLKYSVRGSSNNFIQKLTTDADFMINKVLGNGDFKSLIDKDNDYNHQDVFYMVSACHTVNKWFDTHEDEFCKEEFKLKLLKHVKLIVNKIEDLNEQELFINLNTGRVPLDGADLVRAMLITRVAKQEMEDYDEDLIKDIVRVNERRVRIGWEIDEISAYWSQPEVKEYFKSFSKIITDPQETIKFNEKIHPINLLYQLWVHKEKKVDEKYIKLHDFEQSEKKPLEIYNDIFHLHRTLKDWHEDRQIYHFLGYLFAYSRISFKEVWSVWNKENQTRIEFIQYLKIKIQEIAFRRESREQNENTGIDFWIKEMTDIEHSFNWYNTKRLGEILILLDIIELSQKKEKGNPLPYLRPHFFKKINEDKEHIYPCTPKNIKELKDNNLNGIIKYLKNLNLLLQDKIEFQIDNDQWAKFTNEQKQGELERIQNEIHSKTPINSIGNLVLLHLSINRGFGNDYYVDKRASVINNIHNGEYVRQHTLNVFLKQQQANTEKQINLNDWNISDIKNNVNNIVEKLKTFFDNGVNNHEK